MDGDQILRYRPSKLWAFKTFEITVSLEVLAGLTTGFLRVMPPWSGYAFHMSYSGPLSAGILKEHLCKKRPNISG